MWCHSPSCLVCPLVWPVHYPVALYKLHVMSYSQMSSFHPRLSSPLFSCIVLGACYVIHLVDLFPSSVQHCAPINVSLSQSTRLVVASCWTRKRIQFTWTLILHLNVHFCAWSASTMMDSEWQVKERGNWIITNYCMHSSNALISIVWCASALKKKNTMTTSTTNIFCDVSEEEVGKLSCFP